MGSVTISASFGARGQQIGHVVAERLHIEFLDRAVPSTVARELRLSAESAEAMDERAPSRWERFVTAFAFSSPLIGAPVPTEELLASPESFRSATEAVLRSAADAGGAVVLGRAGMIVLGKRPDVLCVRLDGPLDARIDQAIADGIDPDTARQTQKDVDSAREGYLTFFYSSHQDELRLYHVVLDSTALSVEACADIIVRAATERFSTI